MTKGTFNEVQLHLFINYALRYAVGQNSEIISEYIQALCLNWDAVPEVTKKTMPDGLKQHIDFHHKIIEHRRNTGDTDDVTNLGSPMDADSWIRFYNFIKRKQEEEQL